MIGQVYAETDFELIRLGKCTSSEIAALFTEPKLVKDKEAGNLSETAKKYVRKKASEIITGTVRQLSNIYVEWGNTYEPEAAMELQKEIGDFEYYGKHTQRFFPYTKRSGGSPDGVQNRKVIEIKCPEAPENHVAHCLIKTSEELKKHSADYWYQVQFNMVCVAKELGLSFMEMSGLFVSYYPFILDGFKKLHMVSIEPDAEFYAAHRDKLNKAELYLAEVINDLKVSVSPLIQTAQ